MEFIQYLLSIVAVFFGIVGGFVLSWIAPEELLPGKKYFVFAKKLIFTLILLLLVYFLQLGLFYEILLIVIILLFVIVIPLKSVIFYPATAVILMLVSQQPNFFMVMSVLIFIYGMIISTLFCSRFVKKEKLQGNIFLILFKLLLRYISFLVIGIVVYLILSII